MTEKTPSDGAFRRGLFVLLVAVGVLVSGVYFMARAELQRADQERDVLRREIASLIDAQGRLLTQLESSEERTRRFEQALGAFLAGSSDPAVADPLQRAGVEAAPGTDRRPPAPAPAPAAPNRQPGRPPGVAPSGPPQPSGTPTPPPVVTVVVPVPGGWPAPPPCTSLICIKP